MSVFILYILFLHCLKEGTWPDMKFLNDFEEEKEGEALLNNTKYDRIITNGFSWNTWACPKTEDGSLDVKAAKSGSDLTSFVNTQLFPYLKARHE